ncbi:hypothetical protein BZG36_05522 [Bifiguratus adelaidae]|uniref:NAD(P)-binding domain-containing protein n=1 Tax=Bifiguratus adelaidae TaxID=1938954 RepID=A0A261XTT1_9FUNG|nr:hypothetical protein BZG36_05522 [Bifiguratus adelaidae]
MADNKIYVIGATDNIGRRLVQALLKENIPTTVYTRNPDKARAKFGHASTLNIVKGDYEDLDAFTESITGHTRLYLMVADVHNTPEIKVAVSKIAYGSGVRQVVDVSSRGASWPWRTSYIGHMHRLSEEGIFAIPNRGHYVALRPSGFMTNILWTDLPSIQAHDSISDVTCPFLLQVFACQVATSFGGGGGREERGWGGGGACQHEESWRVMSATWAATSLLRF